MPKNKNAMKRYRILDECFQNDYHLPSCSHNPAHRGCWTLEELIEKIFEKTGISISERTLKNDMYDLKSYYNAPIKNQRGVGWKYEDPHFSIFDNPLSDRDYKILNEITEILKNYRGFKYFEDADSIISKIEDNKLHSDYQKIQLDILPAYSGLKFISKIKEAIFEKKAIQIINKEFDQEEASIAFHPYILKEFNNRWFVLGFANKSKGKFGKLWILALDRIVKISNSEIQYRKPNKKELKLYFSEIYGVTNYREKEAETVIVKIDKYRSNYIRTKPIHKSQTLMKEEVDYDYYSMKLKLNNEIISLFLSFGKDLEVVKPKNFRKAMNEHTEQMFRKYKDI